MIARTFPSAMAASDLHDFLDPLLDFVTSPQSSVDVTTRDRAMIEEGAFHCSGLALVCVLSLVCVLVDVAGSDYLWP